MVLLVLDGWGHAQPCDSNAITHAPAVNFLNWTQKYPWTLLSASGKEVGLPLGLMGNSEVGHTNIGAGRVVYQMISRINKAIEEETFFQNSVLRRAIRHAIEKKSNFHIFGLIGDGGVHASEEHYQALLKMANDMGLPSNNIKIHALLDGRDTPPRSARAFLESIELMCNKYGGSITSLCGRYFGMDRDSNYERTETFWKAMVDGDAPYLAKNSLEGLDAAYARGENDEFVQPVLIEQGVQVKDGDSVLSFNFRADRVRQISDMFLQNKSVSKFDHLDCPNVLYTTMTQYRKSFDCGVAYPPEEIKSTFGEVVAHQGLTQFRCAETEKYAHVSFFFNGGREEVFPGEERSLIPSPKVATYDLKPEMSAFEVTAAVINKLEEGMHSAYVINFANTDMVGHSGLIPATEAAVRAVDGCLKQIVDKVLEKGGNVVITADHGNAEQMIDLSTGGVHTAHTLNPVPFLLIGDEFQGVKMRDIGILADVAPTLLKIMGLDVPEEMDGLSLF
jgi:2,3-bisphosphoglycerate-independent phosphoglycerate mutase